MRKTKTVSGSPRDKVKKKKKNDKYANGAYFRGALNRAHFLPENTTTQKRFKLARLKELVAKRA